MVNVIGNTNNLVASRQLALKTSQSEAEESGLSIEVTPDATNVSDGDKSQNTFELSVTTPQNEYSVGFSREQAVDRLETRHKRKAVDNLVDSGRLLSSPVKTIGITKTIANNQVGEGELQESAVELLALKLRFNSAQTAINQFSNASSDQNSLNTQPLKPAEPVPFVASAVDSYITTQLFFSALDRVGDNLNTQS